MTLLFNGDQQVYKIIKKSRIDRNHSLRLSRWVFCLTKENAILLRNSLSKQVYRLNLDEWAAVEQKAFSSPVVEELTKSRFLVEENYDDLAQYIMIISALRNAGNREQGAKQFTILPTTGCNARCVYCYQQGIATQTMTPEITAKTVDFICSAKREGRIKLHWFGGEPLCASDIISDICLELQKRGVDYTSSITTNGSLFSSELVQKAVALWHLEKAQVSMDGAREDYEARKQYLRPDLYNYDVVMRNIMLLAEAGVKVTIRCNCDLENMSRTYGFIDECALRFLSTGNVHVVPALLKQDMITKERDLRTVDQKVAISMYAEQAGFMQKRGLSSRLATNRCMADAGGVHIIIDPSGGLHVCEDQVGGEPLGSIFDDVSPVWPTTPLTPAEECRECSFLPDCTPFYRLGCPLCSADCKELMERGMYRRLEDLLKAGVESGCITSLEADDEICL